MAGLTACATMINYLPTSCLTTSGGISKLWVFDATLVDFTQAAPVGGVVQPYTAVTNLLGAGLPLYQIGFERMSAEYSFTLKNDDGVAVGYSHEVMFSVPRNDMKASQWAQLINIMGLCCGIGIVFVDNNNIINIMGESSVNASPLSPIFYTWQDGTKGNTGKKATDKNTVNVVLKSCEYPRPLIQYTGALSTIVALSN